MNNFSPERLILYVAEENHEDKRRASLSSVLIKLKGASDFNWQIKDGRGRCIDRIVTVVDKNQLSQEIECTKAIGLQPIVVMPHSYKTWVEELGDHYLDIDPIFYNDRPNIVKSLIMNPSVEFYTSWENNAIHGIKLDKFVGKVEDYHRKIADTFHLWLTQRPNWNELQEKLCKLNVEDFVEYCGGWFVHKASPIVWFENRPIKHCLGCLPIQFRKEPDTIFRPGLIELFFESLLSKKLNTAGAATKGGDQVKRSILMGIELTQKPIMEKKENWNERLLKLADKEPALCDEIQSKYILEPLKDDYDKFISLLASLYEEGKKKNSDGWLMLEWREKDSRLFFVLIAIEDIPDPEKVKRRPRGRKLEFYGPSDPAAVIAISDKEDFNLDDKNIHRELKYIPID